MDMSKFSLTSQRKFQRWTMIAAFQNRAWPIHFCHRVTSRSRNRLQEPLPAHVTSPLLAKNIFTPSTPVHTAAVSKKDDFMLILTWGIMYWGSPSANPCLKTLLRSLVLLLIAASLALWFPSLNQMPHNVGLFLSIRGQTSHYEQQHWDGCWKRKKEKQPLRMKITAMKADKFKLHATTSVYNLRTCCKKGKQGENGFLLFSKETSISSFTSSFY